ncbi:MAG: ATP-dependent Clp protease ATP-binding subunit, partial [Bacteroidia bacterium]|nr:ATP-dependent Clp protease ATP-binding subunit [Bacteroidia bacterium]
MKNNYTKRLFDVLQYSREEAVRLQSSYIGPEHLMLGILRDGNGIAYDTLAELDVNLSLLKKKIEQNLKNSFDDSFDHSEIAVTKETERVLRMSMLEAKLFKKTETGTEHLLLAILKDANNTAASVLLEENVDYRTVYNMLVNGTGMKRLEEESDEIRDGYTDDDD